MSSLKSLLTLLAGASPALSGTIGGRGGSQGYGNVDGGWGTVGGGGSLYGNIGGGSSSSSSNGYGYGDYERPVEGGGGGGQAACGTPGNCYENGCEARFLSEWNVTGVCAAGRYSGCACVKCGDINGACSASGCAGLAGMCQAGPYQGCECGGGPPGVQNHY